MKATQKLHEMGQSLWLDNITRGLLTSGTLRRYIQEFSVTGLTNSWKKGQDRSSSPGTI
jgi:transaldolase